MVKYLRLNNQYTIHSELNCSFLIKKNTTIDECIGAESDSVTLLPPFIGYILSNIGKFEINTSIQKIAAHLQVSPNSVHNFVNKLTSNINPLKLQASGIEIIFPKRLLLEDSHPDSRTFKVIDESSLFDEFHQIRPSVPLNMNFMITSKCTTNCIYCYADRECNKDLTTNKIISIINEAHDIGVVNLTLTGGDIFALKSWKKILSCIYQHNYSTFISTKTPITSEDVRYLYDIGVNELQFSLDSVDAEILKIMLKVGVNYIDKVKQFMLACIKYNIKITVRSVLTKINSSKNVITDLYNFISSFSIVRKWVLTPAFYSEYQSDYNAYAIENNQLSNIFNLTKNFDSKFPILYNKTNKGGYSMKKFNTTNDFILYNQTCYANSYSMSILSSGECTVCEMLYKNKKIILGNVKTQTLKDIWNSKEALNLYNRKRELILEKSTPCYKCRVYEECKNQLAKKVCYVDIIKAYGKNGIDFPDPRCPHSTYNRDIIL